MRRLAALVALLLGAPTPALAHSAARGFVLLLPTDYVIGAGALAVLISFAALAALPDAPFARSVAGAARQRRSPGAAARALSLGNAVVLVALIVIGFLGPRDPAENLLPLAVWTLFWTVIVLAHPLLGDLWAALNPFVGLYGLADRLSGGRLRAAALPLPQRLAYVPAFAIFAGFAWFELVYPAPEDPAVLALALAVYAAATLVAVCLFGPRAWLDQGDPFAVFLSQLGAAAPIDLARGGGLKFPGAGLAALSALPLAGALFVLLTLSSISFDALANTFAWLAAIGVNPLDYPGRSALVGANTAGLALSFVVLALVYGVAVATGWAWAGRAGALGAQIGRFVYSLIPISIAFHFAHYLGDALVKLQDLALALNDPLDNGANLLRFAGWQVTASFQNTASGARALFAAQSAAIVLGHIVGVGVAHMIALRQGLDKGAALRLEAPLAGVMVVYTAFGLWLLATPAIS